MSTEGCVDTRGELPKITKGKINEMIASWTAQTSEPFISFEYFPPKTDDGVAKLHKTIAQMATQEPLFMDFTWGAGGATSTLTLALSTESQKQHDVMVNMHLTCTNQDKELCDAGLNGAKAGGIKNIVALRGDPPKGQERWEVTEGGFACALDLVKYIKANHGDFFSIQVAGYPEGHPDRITKVADLGRPMSAAEAARVVDVDGELHVCSDEDFVKEMAYLKEKCDAGGDVIITQLFYDFDVFKTFVAECRKLGIKADILPGIMPLNAYGGFKRMTGFCKTRIPPAMAAKIESLKGDDQKADFLEFGLQYITTLCQQLVASKLVSGLHFYALNQAERTYQILKRLGYLQDPTKPRLPAKVDTRGEQLDVVLELLAHIEAKGGNAADMGRVLQAATAAKGM
jgi:methylenetetrahydrofolate reductase (NADPH)|eukprot:CAMPEP_0119357526 /NCGR_PEP_ID=MMETSP1334-20130426/5893_1 /TAXON_ID=127549 /ORGANISM="Calcidiscus leptoporus, Strain RCC1130" /LENGTH=399 /DNA_ID=CAMNT_0007371795 /DNA_START=70 /DNA_END=1269 /DNA_ORIENTATION=-